MARRMTDFTTGDPVRKLLQFSWPLILATMLQMFYNTADTLVIGRFVGDTAMGAVGTADTITMLLMMLISGATQGISVIVAQYLGAKDGKRVRRTMMTGLYIIVALSLVFGALGMALSRPLLMLINVRGEALEMATAYLRIIFAGTVFTALYNLGYSASRSLGDSMTPMFVLVFTSIVNIGLNVLFVAGFHMGVEGVAYATVLATVLSDIFCWVLMLKKIPVIRPDRDSLKPDGSIAVLVARLGLPSALMSSTNMIANMIIQSLINGFTTAALPVMAAFAAASKINSFVSWPPGGVAFGMQVLAGQNMGAGKFDRIREGFRATLKIVIGYGVCTMILLIFCGRFFMGLFTDTPATIRIGYQYLVIMGCSVCVTGISFTLRSLLNGCGDAMSATFLSILEVGTQIIAALILSKCTPLGYLGVFLGQPFGWIVGTAVGLIRYRSGKWEEKRIVSKEQA